MTSSTPQDNAFDESVPADGAARECWVITNGAAGNERQALALAACLPWPARSLTLVPRTPWAWFAPRLAPGARLAWPPETLTPPWPAMAIGCGRVAAMLTRQLRQLSGGACKAVQILDPRIDPRHWDAVIAPQHDALRGPNVLNPLGSLNPIDDAWLAAGRDGWAHLQNLPAPRVGVLLGGSRHGIALDAEYAHAFASAIAARREREGGSVSVLASRRTPPALFYALCQALEGIPGLRWGGADDGTNPYPGVLGWADRLVVTPDSVNMLSEACACGCPVHTHVGGPLPDKLARFHDALGARGLLHTVDTETDTRQTPLRETNAVAAALRERLALV